MEPYNDTTIKQKSVPITYMEMIPQITARSTIRCESCRSKFSDTIGETMLHFITIEHALVNVVRSICKSAYLEVSKLEKKNKLFKPDVQT